MPEITVTEAQNGSRIRASVGDVVVIRLAENPTTGYRWHVEAAGGLVPGDDDFSPGSGVGAAGERRFRFATASPGVASIILALRRAWEAAPQGRFELAVDVS